MKNNSEKILLFDDKCNVCCLSASFVKKRNKNIILDSLYSEKGKSLLKEHNIKQDSAVFIENNKAYTYSTAVLRVLKNLKKPWNFLYCLIILPEKFRNFLYKLFSRYRYKIYKRMNSCRVSLS